MHDYKTNFQNAMQFGMNKAKLEWWRILIMGFLGGVYIAIAFYGFVKVTSLFSVITDGALSIRPEGRIAAAAVFPVGILFVLFLGAAVFNGDNLAFLGCLKKESKFRSLLLRWSIVLFANFLGGLVMAYVFHWAAAWNENDLLVIKGIIEGKLYNARGGEWHQIFFSSIVSNIVIVGAIWSSMASKNAVGKILIVWLPIFLLAIAGFNHIPVNLSIYTIGLAEFPTVAASNYGSMWAAIFIYNTLLPTLIGNWISGALILPSLYYVLVNFRSSKNKYIAKFCSLEYIHDGNITNAFCEPGEELNAQAETEAQKAIENKPFIFSLYDKIKNRKRKK
ncbi:formate transporter [Mycoplasma testudineum]|uniref:Formate transporter n=1 Tax=Mycoplasma testudineum TaxID=244584 RepID=A0A4R6IC14_9MOLU|nr:formate/nitrite transporter family protein [Mycoplasma testudineum]OYD26413.1 hypothetical protein CG473_04095 [Mycoplasma testudineum]TDO19770.1 formate transporter [Mycoplasma testudineum]